LFPACRAYGDQCSTSLEPFIEVASVFLRNAHAHQGAQQTTRRRTDPRSGQGRSQGTACDDGAYTGDRESTHTGQETYHPTQHSAADGSGRRSFRGLGTRTLYQLLLLTAVAHGNPNLVLRKAGLFQAVNRSFRIDLILEETDDGPLRGC